MSEKHVRTGGLSTLSSHSDQDTELDSLLQRFFRAQMPEPWPEPPRPDQSPSEHLAGPSLIPAASSEAARPTHAPRTIPETPCKSLTQSRLALATSMAILLGSCWYLLQGTLAKVSTQPFAPSLAVDGEKLLENSKARLPGLPEQPLFPGFGPLPIPKDQPSP